MFDVRKMDGDHRPNIVVKLPLIVLSCMSIDWDEGGTISNRMNGFVVDAGGGDDDDDGVSNFCCCVSASFRWSKKPRKDNLIDKKYQLVSKNYQQLSIIGALEG